MWVLLLDLLCHLTWEQKEAAKLVETSQPMPVAYALYVMGHFMELFLVIIMLFFCFDEGNVMLAVMFAQCWCYLL